MKQTTNTNLRASTQDTLSFLSGDLGRSLLGKKLQEKQRPSATALFREEHQPPWAAMSCAPAPNPNRAARGRCAQTPAEALGWRGGRVCNSFSYKTVQGITYIALIRLVFELENNNVNKVILACTPPGIIFSLQSSMSISLQPK